MIASRTLAALCAAAALVACDSKTEAPTPAPTQPPAAVRQETLNKAAGQMAQGMKGMAQGMAQMVEGMQKSANFPQVQPLHFKELYEVLPEVRGWEMGKPTGQTINMPYTFSQAEAKYARDGGRVEVRVVDGAWHPMMLAPYTMFLKAGFEQETETGYQRSATIEGHPGWEKWDDSKKHGEINVVLGERFLVQYDGRGVSDMDELMGFVKKSDLKKLEKAAKEAQEAAAKAAEAAGEAKGE